MKTPEKRLLCGRTVNSHICIPRKKPTLLRGRDFLEVVNDLVALGKSQGVYVEPGELSICLSPDNRLPDNIISVDIQLKLSAIVSDWKACYKVNPDLHEGVG